MSKRSRDLKVIKREFKKELDLIEAQIEALKLDLTSLQLVRGYPIAISFDKMKALKSYAIDLLENQKLSIESLRDEAIRLYEDRC